MQFSATLQAYHIRIMRNGPKTLLFNHIADFILLNTNFRSTGSENRPNNLVTHVPY